MSYGVGHRHSLDLAWVWYRPAATALIQPLAWKPPNATGVAQKDKYEYIYIYIYIHTHTHAHTHTYINFFSGKSQKFSCKHTKDLWIILLITCMSNYCYFSTQNVSTFSLKWKQIYLTKDRK